MLGEACLVDKATMIHLFCTDFSNGSDLILKNIFMEKLEI